MMTAERKPKSDPMEKRTTETAPVPPEPGGRRKSVFKDAWDCIHRWASRSVPDGKSANTFFRGNVVYSYGTHFPMARWVRLKNGSDVVFLTTRGYSSTTSGHLSATQQAIPKDVTVFKVFDVTANTRREHLDNLNKIAEDAGRARTNKGWLLGQCRSLIAGGNAYAEAVGLKERLPEPEGLEAQKVVADQKELAAIKKREAARRKQAVIDLAEWDQKLAAWHNGGEWPGARPRVGMEPHYAYLRIKGKALETSMRACVPLKVALPILEMVRSRRGYNIHESDAQKVILDGYKLRSIDPELRTVTIGCHIVTFDEIERLAKKHNL